MSKDIKLLKKDTTKPKNAPNCHIDTFPIPQLSKTESILLSNNSPTHQPQTAPTIVLKKVAAITKKSTTKGQQRASKVDCFIQIMN